MAGFTQPYRNELAWLNTRLFSDHKIPLYPRNLRSNAGDRGNGGGFSRLAAAAAIKRRDHLTAVLCNELPVQLGNFILERGIGVRERKGSFTSTSTLVVSRLRFLIGNESKKESFTD